MAPRDGWYGPNRRPPCSTKSSWSNKPQSSVTVSPASWGSTSYDTPSTETVASPATVRRSGSRANAQNRSQEHIARTPPAGRCVSQSSMRLCSSDRCRPLL